MLPNALKIFTSNSMHKDEHNVIVIDLQKKYTILSESADY